MSLQLFNDYNLDIKVRSIDSYVPIGGGGSIPNNSIQNIKLFDKTIENTKIKDGTIVSSLLDANLTVSNDLEVGNNLLVNGNINIPNGSLDVGNGLNVIDGASIDGTLNILNGNINIPNGDLTCTVITATSEIYTNNLLSNEINVNGNINMQGTGSIDCININANGSVTGNIISATSEISAPLIQTTSLKVINGAGSYLVTGNATLDSGEVTIMTTAIDADSFVLVTRTSDPFDHAGFFSVRSIVPNTSFKVFSSVTTDTGNFKWLIINPA